MNIKDAINLIKDEQRSLKPILAFEFSNLYLFTLVTEGGELIGNNALYLVTKDGKVSKWHNMDIPLPDKYQNGKFIKEWNKKELGV